MNTKASTTVLELLTQYNTELSTKIILLENEASCLHSEVERLTESLRISNEKLTEAENELGRIDMIRCRNDTALESFRRHGCRTSTLPVTDASHRNTPRHPAATSE